MKRFVTLIILLSLILQSCSNVIEEAKGKILDDGQDVVGLENDNNIENNASINTDDTKPYYIDLDNLKMEAQPGITNAKLRHTADITPFKEGAEVDNFLSAPNVYIDAEYTYVLRKFPADLNGTGEYDNFYASGKDIREIEVYSNHNYTEIYDTITLTGLGENRFSCNSFVYDSDEQKFYMTASKEVDSEKKLFILTFDKKGQLLAERKLFDVQRYDYLIGKGGVFYLENRLLICEDIESGEKTTVSDDVTHYFESDGVLYYLKSTVASHFEIVSRLCSYNAKTNESTEILDFNVQDRFENAGYDASNGTLYYSRYDGICAYKNGESYELIETVGSGMNLTILQISGSKLLLRVGNNQVSVYNCPADLTSLDNEKISLNICVAHTSGQQQFESLYASIIELMNAVGIPIKLEYTYFTDNSAEYVNTMAKKLMAGDSDFDLFVVDTTMPEIMKDGYYEDLTKYDVLNKYIEQMKPGVKELCSIDGKVVFSPITLTTYSYARDTNIIANAEAPRLFDDIFTQQTELSSQLTGEMDYYMRGTTRDGFLFEYFEQLASNYMAETITDETAEKDLVRLYSYMDKLNEYKKLYIGLDIEKVNAYMWKYYNNGEKLSSEEMVSSPIPKIGEEYKYDINGLFWAINPKSSSKDLAVAFIAYFMNESIKDNLFAQAAYYETDFDYYDETFIEQLADSIRKYEMPEPEFRYHIAGLWSDIQNGTVTPEEAASRTLRYLKMMRDE